MKLPVSFTHDNLYLYADSDGSVVIGAEDIGAFSVTPLNARRLAAALLAEAEKAER